MSPSTIQTAIRSANDPGKTLRRANEVLALYYEADNDPETRAAIRQGFVIALAEYPDWAVQQAFDQWVKTMPRKPSPAEIVILAARAIKPLTDELDRRAKLQAEAQAEQDRRDRERVTPEAASRILAEAGWTTERLANAATGEANRPVQDWTKDLPDDDPRMIQLRAARAASGLVPRA